MKRLITILMHTHWDREWYFTKTETMVLLANHMQNLFSFLKKHPHATYILDGQSVMIDDLLHVAKNYESDLKHYVANGQLQIGPWYTQTDLIIVNGESIIRNLFYGIKTCLPYGKPMLVGYAPDTFGHSPQMPQIYKQFGINSSFFWRGYSQLKGSKSDFVWQGIDGSQIIGVNLATGYQGAKYLENTKEALKERMDKILNVLDNYSATNARLIMNGHDQMPVQEDIDHIVSLLKEIYPDDEIKIGDFASYLASLDMAKLEIVKGELIHSKHARIHKTITSTRQDIKQLNHDLEIAMVNQLEGLSIMASKLNIAYPHDLIENCYKELFGVHAHDSIGGCNNDLVNHDIKVRLLNVREAVYTQLELLKRLITMAVGSFEDGILALFNTYPTKRYNEIVELEIFTRSPSFKILLDANDNNSELSFRITKQEKVDAGLIDRQVAARLKDIWIYKTNIRLNIKQIDGLSVAYLKIEELENKTSLNSGANNNQSKENYIENSSYKITVENNSINLYTRQTATNYNNIIYLENSGDAGDSYDYSPPVNDFVIDKAVIEIVKKDSSDFEEELTLNLSYKLPLNQNEREQKVLSTTLNFELSLLINKANNLISLKLNSTNLINDSRFRLVFNPALKTTTVFADSHLCEVERPIYNHAELEIWQSDNWVEKPVSIETFQSYVYLKDATRQATIFSNGVKEYEVVDGKIKLTLWRSFSHLGKRDLVNRPGRPSGIEIATPDNQLMNEDFTSSFVFCLDNLTTSPAVLSRLNLTPITGYQLKEFNRFNLNKPLSLGKITSHLNLDLGNLVVSAVKYNANNLLFIRLFNPTNMAIEFTHPKLYLSNMLEEKLNAVESIVCKPQEIVNIIID